MAVAGLASAVALILGGNGASAKPSELQQSRSCRAATAKNSRLMVSYDLSSLDACHRRSNRGEQTGDCNAPADFTLAQQCCPDGMIPGGDLIELQKVCRGVVRANAGIAVSYACQATSPVLQNYPPDAVEGGVLLATNVLGPVILSTVGRSGLELQGIPTNTGPVTAKAARRCKDAIGRVRSKIVKSVVAKATACQKKIDQRSTTFGAIDPSCLTKAASSFGDQVSQLRRSCKGIKGADVGSCANLPACVRDSAVATGLSLARAIYGGPTVCGNGVVELGEVCDDGNTDNTDACTTACTLAACGDGFVQAGEECDDGNQFENDSCLNNCKVPACGDGIVNGGEECDDGNTNPDDGCANCRNALTCSGGSVTATLELFDAAAPQLSSIVAGVRLDLGYPAGLSIPGNGLETDDTRLTIIDGVDPTTLLVDRDDNGDGIDDTVRVIDALTQGRTFGLLPFAEVRFDCTAGTPLALDSFNCVVLDASDPLGFNFGPNHPSNPGIVIICRVVSLQ